MTLVVAREWIQTHEVAAPTVAEELDVSSLGPGLHRLAVKLSEDPLSRMLAVPLLVARGKQPGPLVGLTAALHGNELNGVSTIHRLFQHIDPEELRGTVAAVTIANPAGLVRHQREYLDGKDLNRIMPGSPAGTESATFAHRLFHRVINRFEVLLDLHTASFGRINSFYVRADMTNERSAAIARTLGAEIIVHNAGGDGTLRAAAAQLGMPAVTIEIGDPQVFSRQLVKASRIGLRDVLEDFGMLTADAEQASSDAIECARSYWLFTDTGGMLDVAVQPAQRVTAGTVVARLRDPWGQLKRTYRAPEDGVIVGCSSNPVAHTGARIVHIGIVGSP